MRLRIAISVVMWAVLSGSASAGAWGSGSFQNDDALDFSENLAQQPDAAIVYQTLRAVRDRAAYLEAPDGIAAVAAAEVVAALNGHPCQGMPPALEKWVHGQKRPTKEQVALAVAAVQRVRGPASELSELWADTEPSDYRKWELAIQDLIKRLQKRPR